MRFAGQAEVVGESWEGWVTGERDGELWVDAILYVNDGL